jgi:hypothetical protein
MRTGGWIPETIEDEVAGLLGGAGRAEILVGIHAANQVRSVTRVAEAAAAGLDKHFGERAGLLFLVDAASQDGTAQAVQAWARAAPARPPVRCLCLPGSPSRGRAIGAVLAAARRVEATACVLVDGGLVALSSEGIQRLAGPILEGTAEFVSPVYVHTAAEGTLTTNLLAPMTRALYGVRLQQVVGGCAALSRTLVERCCGAEIRDAVAAGHGIEVWLPLEALASGARVVESFLGRKTLEVGLVPPELATIMARTVGAFFWAMERHHEVWIDVRGGGAAPQAGDGPPPVGEGMVPPAQSGRMVQAFRLGLKDLLPVWEQIMPEPTLSRLYPLGLLAPDEFRFPPDLWARVASDFAVGYHDRRLPRDHLLRALTPLYLGRVAAFLNEARGVGPAGLRGALEGVGRAFEAEKEALKSRWR